MARSVIPTPDQLATLDAWRTSGGGLCLVGPPGEARREMISAALSHMRSGQVRAAHWGRLHPCALPWGGIEAALGHPRLPRVPAALPLRSGQARTAAAAALLLRTRADGELIVVVDDLDRLDPGTAASAHRLVQLPGVHMLMGSTRAPEGIHLSLRVTGQDPPLTPPTASALPLPARHAAGMLALSALPLDPDSLANLLDASRKGLMDALAPLKALGLLGHDDHHTWPVCEDSRELLLDMAPDPIHAHRLLAEVLREQGAHAQVASHLLGAQDPRLLPLAGPPARGAGQGIGNGRGRFPASFVGLRGGGVFLRVGTSGRSRSGVTCALRASITTCAPIPRPAPWCWEPAFAPR